MQLSTIILFVITFAILGLLFGIGESFDSARSTDEARDPERQQELFEDCIEDSRTDGELTDDEYFRCAYGIYG